MKHKLITVKKHTKKGGATFDYYKNLVINTILKTYLIQTLSKFTNFNNAPNKDTIIDTFIKTISDFFINKNMTTLVSNINNIIDNNSFLNPYKTQIISKITELINNIKTIDLTTLLKQSTNKLLDEHLTNAPANVNNMGIFDIIKNVIINTSLTFLIYFGNLFKINITNQQDIYNTLDQINKAVLNDNNKKKLMEIVSNLSTQGKDVLIAASPFLNEFTNKVIEQITKASSKISTSIVKIILNTTEEIPILGVLIGTLRSLSNAGDVILALVNMSIDIIKSLFNVYQNAKNNMDNISNNNIIPNTKAQQTSPIASANTI